MEFSTFGARTVYGLLMIRARGHTFAKAAAKGGGKSENRRILFAGVRANVSQSVDWKCKREELKTKRDPLFKRYLKNPGDDAPGVGELKRSTIRLPSAPSTWSLKRQELGKYLQDVPRQAGDS